MLFTLCDNQHLLLLFILPRLYSSLFCFFPILTTRHRDAACRVRSVHTFEARLALQHFLSMWYDTSLFASLSLSFSLFLSLASPMHCRYISLSPDVPLQLTYIASRLEKKKNVARSVFSGRPSNGALKRRNKNALCVSLSLVQLLQQAFLYN